MSHPDDPTPRPADDDAPRAPGGDAPRTPGGAAPRTPGAADSDAPRPPRPQRDPRYPHGPDGPSIHELAGGDEAFLELVDRFYGRVEDDELLRPMYPEDLEPGKRALGLFFAQYWGGPSTYSQERGHPRLRMRHAPFPITQEAALRWAQHMAAAIRSMRFRTEVETALLAYVAQFTPSMVNTMDHPDGLPTNAS